MGENPSERGRILHLQRLSTEDGPGIRTTVFFKGCPLACAWCHNPESIPAHFQVQWLENRCIGCNSCLEACPNGGLSRDARGVQINREICTGCGECAAACPACALEQLGSLVSVDELVSELLKDRVYFEKSGGGVTLSGGEPTLQASFALALLRRLRQAGVQTALDTCGFCRRETLERLLPEVDVLLYDLKLADPQAHVRYTGQDNRLILDNLRWLGKVARQRADLRVWVRTPLIPGSTDSPENIRALAALISESLGTRLGRWELCAFNNLCRDKYRRLGLVWDYQDTPLFEQQVLDELQDLARSCGLPSGQVAVTGAARAAAIIN